MEGSEKEQKRINWTANYCFYPIVAQHDMCTLHQPLKAIRNHQFFVRSSIDCQLSLFLSVSVSVSLFLSVSVSRLDIVEGSINTKLRLIQVHHRWHDFSNRLFRVSICPTCSSVELKTRGTLDLFFFFLLLDWKSSPPIFFQKNFRNKRQFIYFCAL